MPICHGKGNPETDGCCYVSDGTVCPLRWKIVNDRILEGPDLIDRGSATAYIDTLIKGPKANRDRAKAQIPGVAYACRAAIEVLAADGTLVNNRTAFNTAWNNHTDYVAQVRPHWAIIEQREGLPAGSYQCSTWKGTGTPQCCYSESQSTNDSRKATLTTTAVTVRQAGGL